MKPNADHGAPRPSDDESIEATAAAWLAERDAGLTPEDERAFARWRAADPRHETVVVRLENAWAGLQRLRDFRPAAQRHPDRDLLAPRSTRKKTITFPARAVALAAAAVVMLAVAWWAGRPIAAPATLYTTTAGGYERVMLADGSVVELNGDTAAEVRLTAAERRVRLTHGEAHFTVAKNAARPFWVEAGGVTVRAVGTAFNVRLGAAEIEVLVTEGKVAVNQAVQPAPAAGPRTAGAGPSANGNPTLLHANERARIATAPAAVSVARSTPVVERVAPEALREALAWQGPRLVFVDTPLAEVIAQFNRRNPVQLSLGDPSLATLPVGGNFRAENVDAFVRLLVSDGDVTAEQPDATHMVLRRKK